MEGVWRWKVNIVVGDNIGHTGKVVHIHMCQILNGYLDTAVWIYKCKTTVNGNKEIV